MVDIFGAYQHLENERNKALGRAIHEDANRPEHLCEVTEQEMNRGNDILEGLMAKIGAILLPKDANAEGIVTDTNGKPDYERMAKDMEKLNESGNFEQVLSGYKGLLSGADNQRFLIAFAESKYLDGEKSEAMDLLQRAICLNDSSYQAARAHNWMGHVLSEQNNLDEAIKHYQRSVDLNGPAIALYNLGQTIVSKARVNKDKSFLKDAIIPFQEYLKVGKDQDALKTAKKYLPVLIKYK